ncbi:MAG: ATP-dependent protease [Planctomycetaceae bacterium]|nr:ATP-dependent protease [Planctomycetaceae bacterium]
MWEIDNLASMPDDFSGTVRLFPLPDLVMFPHVVQPLHIYEPRYRSMLEDALADDRLLAMSLLQPGWELDYDGRPEVSPITCVGQVVTHTPVEEGKYNLLLMGVRRATIVNELPPDDAFRRAEVVILEDLYPKAGANRRSGLQRELLRCFRKFLPDSPAAQEQFEALMGTELPLGVLADIVAFTVPLELEVKHQLLKEWNVDARVDLLMDGLQQLNGTTGELPPLRPFPPDFSEN